MAICPKCGREVEEDVKYCPYCGAEISIDMDKLKIQLEDLKHNEKQSWIIIGLGVLFFVLGLLLFIPTEREEHLTYIKIIHPYYEITISLLIFAVISIATGGISGFYYRYKRDKLLKEKGLK